MVKISEKTLSQVLDAIAQVPASSRRKAGLLRTIKRIESGKSDVPTLDSVYNVAVNEVRLRDDPTEQARERRRLDRLAQGYF
jgi:hypothetical protein